MPELKRSQYYDKWLAFVETAKDSKMLFGPSMNPYDAANRYMFSIGNAVRNLEWATVISSGHHFDLPSVHMALGFFDAALDRFYTDQSPTFQGIRKELEQDTIGDACAAFVILSISSYAEYNIIMHEVEIASATMSVTMDVSTIPLDIKINNRVLVEAVHMAPMTENYVIKSDEDLKLFIN